MSIWMILSWVFVAILTAINIFVFLKLKGASEQMLKMAFPGAKDMNEALSQMQGMMQGMGGMGGAGGMANMQKMMQGMGGAPRGGARPGGAPNMDAQLKAAMEKLQQMQKSGKNRR